MERGRLVHDESGPWRSKKTIEKRRPMGWVSFMTVAVVMTSSAGAAAADSRCAAFFIGAQAPDLHDARLTTRTHALCFRFYSLLESGVTRTALWSAEHLTRESVASAHEEKRVDAFHAESEIDGEDRAEIADYRASGYDRGHMAPSGDMPDAAAQEESFSLANMVPQAPDNNRHLWQGIEITTRALAKADGELYVVTGPIFSVHATELDARVEIPSHIWKAIYDPSRGAAAYVTANRPGNGYAVVSIATLTQMTGIDPFPSLSEAVKTHAIALPPPRPSGRRMKSGPVSLTALGLSDDRMASSRAFVSGGERAALSTTIFAGKGAAWPASEAELFGNVPLARRLDRLGAWLQHFAVAERLAAIGHDLGAIGGYLAERIARWTHAGTKAERAKHADTSARTDARHSRHHEPQTGSEG